MMSGAVLAVSTAPIYPALFDVSSTAKDNATGVIALPSSETSRPMKNHLKAGK